MKRSTVLSLPLQLVFPARSMLAVAAERYGATATNYTCKLLFGAWRHCSKRFAIVNYRWNHTSYPEHCIDSAYYTKIKNYSRESVYENNP